MTRSEFRDYVLSAHAEYFPKANATNRDAFIAVLMDDLEGTDIELESDEEEEVDNDQYDE